MRHGIRIRRLRLHADDRTYDVDFRTAGDEPRPLSVIAGALGTGKTTILEFVDYCLGAADHPRHAEIMPKVRAATLEAELSGAPHLIERGVGEPSTYAYVSPGLLDDHGPHRERRPLDAAALSGLLLAHCKLQGARLGEDGSDPLSFRDLMPLCLLPNERLGSRHLLFDGARAVRLRQVVDVLFDVQDERAIELGRRLRRAESALSAAREADRQARDLVAELEPGGRADLEDIARRARAEIAAGDPAGLDERLRAGTGFAADVRARHRAAADAARRAAALLRDHETRARRLTALRVTYADDVSKLIMLTEAARLLPPPPIDGSPSWLIADVPGDLGAEVRSARARLAELTAYLAGIESGLPALRAAAERAQAAESRAAAEADAVTAPAVTPYLAQRDTLARRRADAAVALQRAAGGLRLIHAAERRAAAVQTLQAELAALREELGGAAEPGTGRAAVIARIGARYRSILRDWQFPRPGDAYVADDLTPYTRGEPYTAASSGGRTLIALAWQLALFETAWESRSSHPGFLLLDSPQKNLDAPVVARIYRHLERWLAGPGAGAQIVVADSAPPPAAASDVIVRFSGRPDRPPHALIDDEPG